MKFCERYLFSPDGRRTVPLPKGLFVGFRNGTGAVGVQQKHQIVHPGLKLPALIGVGYLHPDLQPFKDLAFVGDIRVAVDGLPFTGEALVGHDPKVPGVEDQGIAGNAGGAPPVTAPSARTWICGCTA